MRLILILWAIPIVLFWGWYWLSFYDLHFGLYFLERGFHDLLFQIYSNILKIPAEDIPRWLAWVFFIDTLAVLAIAALRWYKHWLPQFFSWLKEKSGLVAEQGEYEAGLYETVSSARQLDQNSDATGPALTAK